MESYDSIFCVNIDEAAEDVLNRGKSENCFTRIHGRGNLSLYKDTE